MSSECGKLIAAYGLPIADSHGPGEGSRPAEPIPSTEARSDLQRATKSKIKNRKSKIPPLFALLVCLCTGLSRADWPTFQGDNARTGWSPQTVAEPFKVRWRWHETSPGGRTQPVIAAGKVFLGGGEGKFYAIDEKTGQTAWSFTADGPILASAAVADGKVYFATAARTLYALDAITGQPAWQFHPDGRGGFWAAPAVADGLVLIGSRDKTFYALSVADGQPKWRFHAAGWIVTPAAVGEGKVFFGAEDEMAAYALNLADGTLAWRQPISGQTFRDSWPVYNATYKKVVFTAMPRWPFHYNLREADNAVLDFTVGAGWELERKFILEYLCAGRRGRRCSAWTPPRAPTGRCRCCGPPAAAARRPRRRSGRTGWGSSSSAPPRASRTPRATRPCTSARSGTATSAC